MLCNGGTVRDFLLTFEVNQNQHRYASSLPSVVLAVLARGHRIEQVEEVHLVSSDEKFTETKEAIVRLNTLGAHADAVKVSNSRKL